MLLANLLAKYLQYFVRMHAYFEWRSIESQSFQILLFEYVT